MYQNIIHIHIPSFPITLERTNRPELRDRPVVIAPPRADRAIILSVSPEAGREGIFKGMTLGNALKFCPDLTVLPPNPALVEKGCGVLSAAVARYTPLWEPSRPGHVYLDVTGTERLWGRAKDAAWRIGRDIGEDMSLPVAAGVAGNKMVSSIASRLIPSRGVLDVDHGRESSFMAPLSVDFLPGIGHIRKRMLLEELNISLVRQVAALTVHDLRLIFGGDALLIHERAMGIDPTPVSPPSSDPSVSESITIQGDENDDVRLLGMLYGLVERCSRRLRTRGMVPRRAGLTIRHSDQSEAARQTRVSSPCPSDLDLYADLERLFFKACARRTGVRFMRVWFRELSPPLPQLSLFSHVNHEGKKREKITGAMDRIRERYGDGAIRLGRTV
ncbi:MAG: DNA polymerase IV [Deltaproteobacteria bacterium]|nr:DNA polymerase IV [Deltaproteobacteria bacterium]